MSETRKQKRARATEEWLDSLRDRFGLSALATSSNGRACNRKVEKRKRAQYRKEKP